jgi:hypothetical protein
MAQFMVIYNNSLKASELMARATQQQMEASVQDWLTWRDAVSGSFKVQFGLPLQAIGNVSPAGVAISTSRVSGYSLFEGESQEALMEALKNHPHLKRPNATIDVFMMLAMPGLESQVQS